MFAPLIVLIGKYFGQKKLNQVRGQLIALHIQTMTRFCDRFGIDRNTRHHIRMARDNGKRLGGFTGLSRFLFAGQTNRTYIMSG
jgi:hypothetical protein